MTIENVVAFLNKALNKDRDSINKVFLDIGIDAEDWMIEHPTVQVTMDYKLRFIGVLNGLVSDKHSCIQMIIDDETQKIDRFTVGTLDQHNHSISRM